MQSDRVLSSASGAGAGSLSQSSTALNDALLGVYTARCRGGTGAGIDGFLPPRQTSFFGFARQALVEALRRLDIRDGDEVLVPGFICREVLASLSVVGVKPRFYRVNESLHADAASLEEAATRKVRAALAVNYFGFPQPLGPFREWCDARGAALIEDNAHGFLSADGQTPLGLRGDLGLFSLRKTLVLPNGAALADNRPGGDAARVPARPYTGSSGAAERRYRAKVMMKRVMQAGGLGVAQSMVASIRGVRALITGSAFPVSAPESETVLPGERFSPLTERLLHQVDVPAEAGRRRALYRWCQESLSSISDISPLFGDLTAGVVPQGFPFRLNSDRRGGLIAECWRRGLQVLSWPDLPSAGEAIVPPHYQNVFLVPFLW